MTLLIANLISRITNMIADIRHNLGIVTEAEARLAYVEGATDRVDLEMRLREVDRPSRSFDPYPGNVWRR